MLQFLPILVLLLAIGLVLWRLPKIDLGHSDAFKRRRVLNWVPMGLTYAFLYMGRYNLKVAQKAFTHLHDAAGDPLMGNREFGIIFGIGSVVYGMSFLLNGPLTDHIGGKRAILIGATGAAVANLAMFAGAYSLTHEGPGYAWLAEHFVVVFSALYAVNMYFQSFGAAAIVKVNAPWFHVRERGIIGAVFGILISLGVYFAFDWSKGIRDSLGLPWVFAVPGLVLFAFVAIVIALVKDSPGEAGFEDFDTGDASSGDDGPPLRVLEVFQKLVTNRVILTIAFVEFCSGFLRQAIMQWYPSFANQTNEVLHFAGEEATWANLVMQNWGLLLCAAGILGGTVAGLLSDYLFQSRRGPVAGILYGVMLAGSVLLTFVYPTVLGGWLIVFMSMAVIGVHGMLSGTASMDFGGKKNVGVAVGIIDGFVYLGTFTMAFVYGYLLPQPETREVGGREIVVGPAADPANWWPWPVAMIPVALIGFLLALTLWNAKPRPQKTKQAEEADRTAPDGAVAAPAE